MAVDRQRIDELAYAVAERLPVAWKEELRSSESEDERMLVAQLQNVERIVEAHWGLPGSPTRLGDFEIIREIGRGAMGVVYEVRQISLDRRVAIKVLSAEMTSAAVPLQRFEREARALAALNHPNIVTIHSVEEVDTSAGFVHFISMELVEGESLARRIPAGGMLIQRLLDIAIPLADALSSAHERRVIHRDLKPANIMVNREGRVKILDFGLAKLRREHRIVPDARSLTASFGTTREGALLGTVPYMSPEQAEGRDLDHRSDLFSLGVILYEMAMGRRPFQGSSPAAVISSILRDRVPPVTEINPELPADLERMISHCLRKDPEHRYQTAKGLRNELEELRTKLQLDEIRSPREPSKPTARRSWGLWRSLFATSVVLLVALAIGPSVVQRVQGWLGIVEPAAARYLAVLPFAVLGDEHEDTNAISDGLAEILTTKLTRLTRTHDLQVAASGLSRGSPPPSIEAIGELGVNLVVVGSLHRSGDDVRVTVNLVDVREGRQLRAEIINANLRDPFMFQDRIAVVVVEMLELELPSREEEALRAHGTTVAAANRLYLQGRGYLRNYDQVENVDRAIGAFQQALEQDPDYAQAHAGLGMAYWKRFEHDDDAGWVDQASKSCRASVKLDDKLPEGHACLGTVYSGTGRHGEAEVEFGWAISLDSTLDEAFRGLARVYDRLGDPDAAEEVYRKAISIRPHYWAGYSWLGAFYFYQGRYADSEKMFRRVTELTPESYGAYSNLGGAYLLQGRFEEAIPVLERSLELKTNVDAHSNLGTAYFKLRRYDDAVPAFEKAVGLEAGDYGLWGNLAEAYYWSGQRDKAPQAYRRAMQLAQESLKVNPKDPWVLGELAKYHAMLGDREEAVGYLEQALRLAPADAELQFGAAVAYNQLGQSDVALDWLEKALAGGLAIAYVQDAPEFENLRDQERFQQLRTNTGSETTPRMGE